MRAFNWLKKLRSNERGNVLVIGAATMPLLIGSAAIAVDTIQLSLSKRQLQRAADSGALAGAHALVQDKPVAASVTYDLGLNNDIPVTGAPVIENAPTAGAFAGDARAVRVVLTATRQTPFMSFFNSTPATVRVEATAAIVFTGKFCMVSLETGNVTGVTFSGSTSVDLGCGIATNSTSANAVVAGGSSTVKATPIAAVGNVPSSSHFVSPTKLMPYSAQQEDPFAALPVPTIPAGTTCQNKLQIQPNDPAYTVPVNSAGIYCYKGMDVKGTLNLQPGVYYIDGGKFDLGSQAVVNGTGVTIILTSRTAATSPSSIATIDMNGGAVMNMSAPTSGTYEGVLMYQDPRATLGGSAKINGHSSSVIEGAFYFPRIDLTFNGNSGMQTRCLQLVARRLFFTGNSSVSNTCPTEGGADAFDAAVVRLVG